MIQVLKHDSMLVAMLLSYYASLLELLTVFFFQANIVCLRKI